MKATKEHEEEKEMTEYKGMEKRIELLEEMGKYYAADIENIEKELEELKKLGYDCYFDSNSDYIILDK